MTFAPNASTTSSPRVWEGPVEAFHPWTSSAGSPGGSFGSFVLYELLMRSVEAMAKTCLWMKSQLSRCSLAKPSESSTRLGLHLSTAPCHDEASRGRHNIRISW